jgi:hypothetical protein
MLPARSRLTFYRYLEKDNNKLSVKIVLNERAFSHLLFFFFAH